VDSLALKKARISTGSRAFRVYAPIRGDVMQAQKPMTKTEQRQLMAEFDLKHHQTEQDRPAEQRHDNWSWTTAFWLARQVLS
jgi:hypothetical protein